MPYHYVRDLPYSTSPFVRRVLVALFVISIGWDIDLLFSKALIAHGMMNPQTWSSLEHFVVAVGEAIAIVAATILWLIMLYSCLVYSRSNLKRLLWIIGFMVTIWWGAQLYYLFVYRHREPTSRPTPL
jgi:hypothetical protein